jgi:hypothetical protein
MSEVLAQVKINAPTEKVWEMLVDSDRLSEWLPNSISLGSNGVDGSENPGPKYYHYDLFSTVKERATGREPGKSYSYVVENAGFIKSAHNSFHLSDSEGGTLLTQTINFQMKYGPLGNIMDNWIFRPQFNKQMEASLAALKNFVEANTSPGSDTEVDHLLAA